MRGDPIIGLMRQVGGLTYCQAHGTEYRHKLRHLRNN